MCSSDLWLDGTTGTGDLAGNSLDGEWPGSEPGFPSGDGVPGGDFVATVWLESPVVLSPARRQWIFRDADGDTVSVHFGGERGQATLARALVQGAEGDLQTVFFEGTDHRTSLKVRVKESTGRTPKDGTSVQTI